MKYKTDIQKSIDFINSYGPDLLKEINDARELKKKDPYSYSDLPEYLEYDTWKDREGLLLIAGISPTGAAVDWGYENFMGEPIDGAIIHNAQPLNEIDDLYMTPAKQGILEDIEATKNEIKREKIIDKNEEEVNKLEKKLTTLEKFKTDENLKKVWRILSDYEDKLGRVYKLWESRNHPNERHSKEYFIEWAKEKNIHIDWLEWAKTKGYFTDLTINDQPEINYSTPLIEIQNAAIYQFWVNYDPQKPPKKGEIISWLVSKHDVTKRQAEAIDLIIRPPSRKKGGNIRRKI